MKSLRDIAYLKTTKSRFRTNSEMAVCAPALVTGKERTESFLKHLEASFFPLFPSNQSLRAGLEIESKVMGKN